MSADGPDTRDRIDGERLHVREAPNRDPARAFDIVKVQTDDGPQWTLSETDVTDFYTRERWLTVTDESIVLSLEAWV